MPLKCNYKQQYCNYTVTMRNYGATIRGKFDMKLCLGSETENLHRECKYN